MERKRTLTPKEKKYARARAKGLNYTDAYIEAGYSCKGGNRHTACDNARKWENADTKRGERIRAEIDRLQRLADNKTILDRKQRQTLLTELALDSEEKTDNRLRAVDMLNRMSGDYTDNVRTSATVGVELTYEERKKLLEAELGE